MTMRAIKKVQNNCSLLYLYTNNPEILLDNHEGYLFDKINRNDGLYQYNVYICGIKMMSKITIRNNLDNYTKKTFKIYFFIGEHDLKKKLRLQLIE